MKYALSVSKDNRILSAWEVLKNRKYDGMPIVSILPEGDITDYLYVDEQYIYDPLPKPEPAPQPAEESVWDQLDAAYQRGVDSV